MKRLLRRLRKRFIREQWVLGYFPNQGDLLYTFQHFDRKTLSVIYPPNDRFYADPFVVYHGGDYYIFFEELKFRDNKGVIQCMHLSGGVAGIPHTVLNTNCHLSYPFIFEHEGRYYMVPETSDRGTIELYECISFPYRWKPSKVLFQGLKLVDATLFYQQPYWYIIACESFRYTTDPHLYLLSSKDLFGEWQAHRLPQHGRNGIRGAGKVIAEGGRLLRPVQAGGKRYGTLVQLNEITVLSPGHLEERPVAQLAPRQFGHFVGLHTINLAGDKVFIDLNRDLLAVGDLTAPLPW
jgi:hypothetical protein